MGQIVSIQPPTYASGDLGIGRERVGCSRSFNPATDVRQWRPRRLAGTCAGQDLFQSSHRRTPVATRPNLDPKRSMRVVSIQPPTYASGDNKDNEDDQQDHGVSIQPPTYASGDWPCAPSKPTGSILVSIQPPTYASGDKTDP